MNKYFGVIWLLIIISIIIAIVNPAARAIAGASIALWCILRLTVLKDEPTEKK